MDGIHDMGGMDGFGPIEREEHESVFHAPWEKRCFALNIATPAAVPTAVDSFRQAIERLPTLTYLKSGYYQRWAYAIENLLVAAGILTPGQVAAVARGEDRRHEGASPAPAHLLRADEVSAAIAGGETTARPAATSAPRFKVGDAVRARNIHPKGHTRLPRYARGRRGVIERDHGIYTFADSVAAHQGDNPQHLYCVRFAAAELWGDASRGNDIVFLDLWDAYLDPA